MFSIKYILYDLKKNNEIYNESKMAKFHFS